MLPGSPSPVYPPHLREAGIGGSVVLRFVVGEKGLPDANHVQLIKSPGPDFTSAVYRSLYYAKFKPGILRGKPVRQWVQMQFDFKVTVR
jgi:protein TonB